MKIKVVLALFAILIACAAPAAFASNMGFKINMSLTTGYSNFVSLPYFNSYLKAADVFADVPNCVSVSRFDNTTQQFTVNTGSTTRKNFDIVPGEGYVIQVSANTSWVVVGSHNDTLGINFTTGYSNFLSVPYHTTATNAADLFAQIPNCVSVSRFDNTIQQYVVNTGSTTRKNFSLTPGEALVIQVSSNDSGWLPPHY